MKSSRGYILYFYDEHKNDILFYTNYRGLVYNSKSTRTKNPREAIIFVKPKIPMYIKYELKNLKNIRYGFLKCFCKINSSKKNNDLIFSKWCRLYTPLFLEKL